MSKRSLNCLIGEKLAQTQLCVLHRRASISGAGRGYVFQLGRQKVVGINWKNFCKRCIVRISKIDCILKASEFRNIFLVSSNSYKKRMNRSRPEVS